MKKKYRDLWYSRGDGGVDRRRVTLDGISKVNALVKMFRRLGLDKGKVPMRKVQAAFRFLGTPRKLAPIYAPKVSRKK